MILDRARDEPTNSSQSRDGPASAALEVRISTLSPLRSSYSRATNRPLTREPTVRWPTSVCTEYAKSTGVDPRGSATTSPFGVNTKTSSAYRSRRMLRMNSPESAVSDCHSSIWDSHWASDSSPRLAALYFQWAAMPNSAVRCMAFVRICTSIGLPSGPTTVVCSDW